MTQLRFFGFLVLASTFHATPAIAVLSTDDMLRIQMQVQQMSQAARQGQILQDSQIVRPSPKERNAISQMLTTKPRPKTLNDSDMKYLKDLLDKATWFGFERRILHEIWKEVSGKEWLGGEEDQIPKTETSP